ncbi:matrixin family metalloprotease [Actinomadura graeca]|uniref:Matrixin family metalloprotease n=1 Tax=Actinomadura graeca TaxID=2750812 RepID=A0ABX8QVB2_9ACTN|nr:matrixin family metalloprotease [Actinomadura graeca]QXJ22667.1 matrixin family metalloprotease [Actinomadura graeca]
MDAFPPAWHRHRNGTVAAAAVLALTVPLAPAAAASPGGAHRRPPAWCKPGPLTARAMPEKINLARCDLRGRTVRGANGLAVVVPRDGASVTAHELRTDGAAELRVRVDPRAGEITISTRGARVPQGRPRGTRAALDPCQDGTYRAEPGRWPKGGTVRWHFSPGTGDQPVTGIAAGIANIVGARTDCTPGRRYAPPPDVREANAGRTDRTPNITVQAGCGPQDRMNTFGWLAMREAEPEVLAATCLWFEGGRTIETDMALQTHGKRWWPGTTAGDGAAGGCPAGGYDTAAVVTHESGHVLGLSHVEGPEHARLTMAPFVRSCDDGLATLGKGDYDGLISLYGRR